MRSWITSNGSKIVQVLSRRSNVFILKNNVSTALIDTGPEFMWKTLLKKLNQIRVNQINLIILTHSHFDHAANANKIKEKYNAQVVIHNSEAAYLLAGTNILPAGTNPISKLLVRVFAKQFISIAKYKPCHPDILVDDFFDLSSYGFNAFLIHTPGHTEGSISIIIDNELAIVGDTMFGVFPWTIFPPFAIDTVQLVKSWEKLLNTKCRVFLPSHGFANKRSLVEKDLAKRNYPKNPV